MRYFIFILILQTFAAFCMLVFSSENLYFRYRPTAEDLTLMIYNQVDEGVIGFIFIVEVFIFIMLLIIAIINFTRAKYDKSVLLRISSFITLSQLLLCIYFVVGTINFSQSLVSCDDFVFGESSGCYIPTDRK